MMSPWLELAGTQGHFHRLAPLLGLASLALAYQVNLRVPLPGNGKPILDCLCSETSPDLTAVDAVDAHDAAHVKFP